MLLIFDLDGTLIDSRSCIVKATQQAFMLGGFQPPSEADIAFAMGIPIEVTFPKWAGTSDTDKLIQTYRAQYAEYAPTEIKTFEGIPDIVAKLSAHHKLAIATSKKRSVAESNLAQFDLLKYFAHVVGSDDVLHYKPHPESIERILMANNDSTVEAWMIGDATTDIEMGQAAKIRTCAVSWGAHSASKLGDLNPTSMLHQPQELLALFGVPSY